jgi:hypothetical protein
MRILQYVGGGFLMAVGFLLCIPPIFLIWYFFNSELRPGSGIVGSEIYFKFGDRIIAGWQVWAFHGGLVLVGLILVIGGFLTISSKRDG